MKMLYISNFDFEWSLVWHWVCGLCGVFLVVVVFFFLLNDITVICAGFC